MSGFVRVVVEVFAVLRYHFLALPEFVVDHELVELLHAGFQGGVNFRRRPGSLENESETK